MGVPWRFRVSSNSAISAIFCSSCRREAASFSPLIFSFSSEIRRMSSVSFARSSSQESDEFWQSVSLVGGRWWVTSWRIYSIFWKNRNWNKLIFLAGVWGRRRLLKWESRYICVLNHEVKFLLEIDRLTGGKFEKKTKKDSSQKDKSRPRGSDLSLKPSKPFDIYERI